MRDLFGEPERWSQTLRSLLWTHASVVVPSFQGSTLVDLQVPCTFDFNVAATKYFEGLRMGRYRFTSCSAALSSMPMPRGVLQVAPISWEQEARFKLPVKVWREMMDSYYPNTVWLNLRRDVFERLYQYKIQHGIPTWEQALESMLARGRDGELDESCETGWKRSPRPCSTRATCSIPIARPRSRISSAGILACSARGPTAKRRMALRRG